MKVKALIFLLLISCGGYIDTSFENDVIESHSQLFSDISNEELLEQVSETCTSYYRDYEVITDGGDWGGFIIEIYYQKLRNMRIDPYIVEDVLESQLNYCGFSTNYASLDTDIVLCMYEYDYQVYYLGNQNYDDKTIPCEK